MPPTTHPPTDPRQHAKEREPPQGRRGGRKEPRGAVEEERPEEAPLPPPVVGKPPADDAPDEHAHVDGAGQELWGVVVSEGLGIFYLYMNIYNRAPGVCIWMDPPH